MKLRDKIIAGYIVAEVAFGTIFPMKKAPHHDVMEDIVNSETTAMNSLMNEIGMHESNNRYAIMNPFGYAGKYQVGGEVLLTQGYVKDPQDEFISSKKNGKKNIKTVDWEKVTWTGKDGIDSIEDFLHAPEVQEKVMLELMRSNATEIKRNLTDRQLENVIEKYNWEGLLSAAHIGGAGGTIKHIKTKGRYNPQDANGTKISDYLNAFKEHELTYNDIFSSEKEKKHQTILPPKKVQNTITEDQHKIANAMYNSLFAHGVRALKKWADEHNAEYKEKWCEKIERPKDIRCMKK